MKITKFSRHGQHMGGVKGKKKGKISQKFDKWIQKQQEEKTKKVVIIPMITDEESRRHSYAIYEYEFILLAKEFRLVNKNVLNGENPHRTSDNYNRKDPQWAIVGFIFKNYKKFAAYAACNIDKRYLTTVTQTKENV